MTSDDILLDTEERMEKAVNVFRDNGVENERLKIIKVFNANPAFHSGSDLADLILEAAQSLEDAFVDAGLAAHHAHLAFDQASAADNTTGNVAALGQLKNLAHFGRADDRFLQGRLNQPGHGLFDLVGRLQFVKPKRPIELATYGL